MSAMTDTLSIGNASVGGFAVGEGGLRHRIFIRVEDPARLGREIHARRAEDVDENVDAGIDSLRGVDRRRRDHGNRWRAATFMIVIAPLAHVSGPGPAQMMNEGSRQRQRALLEIVVVMWRHPGGVAWTVPRLQEVHHERRAAEDSSKPPRLLRHVETVGPDPGAAARFGPWFERGKIGVRGGVGFRIAAEAREVRRSCRHHAHDLGGAEQFYRTRTSRDEADGMAADRDTFAAPDDFRARTR